MKNFLAIYIGTEESAEKSGWNKLSDKDRQERENSGIQAWGQWAQEHQKSIVDMGTPLGKTKKADRNGIASIKNAMTAYTIIQAESHEEAANIFKNHPHFSIFPGDSIEIMECLPLPK